MVISNDSKVYGEDSIDDILIQAQQSHLVDMASVTFRDESVTKHKKSTKKKKKVNAGKKRANKQALSQYPAS